MEVSTPSLSTTSSSLGIAPPAIRTWLRAEGFATFVAGIAIFVSTGGPWPLLLPLLLLPDVSMVGYLRGPRLGALTYNVVHTWATALPVLGLGLWSGTAWLTTIGAVLVAHVGMDRAAGYGLKLPTSFHETHLGWIGKERDRQS
jgi:Domain of unknown function (DUF4260)